MLGGKVVSSVFDCRENCLLSAAADVESNDFAREIADNEARVKTCTGEVVGLFVMVW